MSPCPGRILYVHRIEVTSWANRIIFSTSATISSGYDRRNIMMKKYLTKYQLYLRKPKGDLNGYVLPFLYLYSFLQKRGEETAHNSDSACKCL